MPDERNHFWSVSLIGPEDDEVMICVVPARFGYRCGDAWRPTFPRAKNRAEEVIEQFERLGYRKIPERQTVRLGRWTTPQPKGKSTSDTITDYLMGDSLGERMESAVRIGAIVLLIVVLF